MILLGSDRDAGARAFQRQRLAEADLAGFGVQDRLSTAIEVEPRLVELLFDLDPTRMHLMALALAHLASDVTPDLALILLQGTRKTILNLSLGHHHPFGLKRALSTCRRKFSPPKAIATSLRCSPTDRLPSSCITANRLTKR
jgi:hypothetical protein